MQTMLVSKLSPYPIGEDFEFNCPLGKEAEGLLKQIQARLPKIRVRVFREDFMWYVSIEDTCEVVFVAYPKSVSGD